MIPLAFALALAADTPAVPAAPVSTPAARAASSRIAEISILAAERKIEAAGARPDPPSLALSRLLLDRARRAYGEGKYEEAWQIAREASASIDAAVAAGPRIERTAPAGATPERLFDLESRLAAARAARGDTDWRVTAAEDLLLVARTAAERGDLDEAIRLSNRGLSLLEREESPPAETSRMDLATAPRAELSRLPGMTPARVRALLWFREEIGFRMPEDLVLVPGFDAAAAGEILPLVEVGR